MRSIIWILSLLRDLAWVELLLLVGEFRVYVLGRSAVLPLLLLALGIWGLEERGANG